MPNMLNAVLKHKKIPNFLTAPLILYNEVPKFSKITRCNYFFPVLLHISSVSIPIFEVKFGKILGISAVESHSNFKN